MAASLTETRVAAPLAERLVADSGADVVLHWLGQAGFLIQAGRHRLLIDPYLSDTLAEKYRGRATPHERLMPAPIEPEALGAVDLVIVTHHHTDHMDPGTLAPLAARLPGLRFVVPKASAAEAMRRAGVSPERLIAMEAGEKTEPLPGLVVTATRAAHETLERDAEGHHRFLGYGLSFAHPARAPLTLFHSGDTVPFPGQVEEVRALRADLALLPVNGRSAALAAQGIAGNLTLDEALALTGAVGIPAMIAHHHGLFAFNTRSLPEIEAKAAEPGLGARLVPARIGSEIRLAAADRA
ncbi:MBL fold metallo-hydrolase [Aureimonas endophytica]|uniref:MBL fold metallo-hydrolase n=1 Tax=Aureimonas endophytica TaxID=2027858 RepID=A0A916ZS58_9HYPH|nr:MBL fold metallo-hydrolase [Aureimonas endophytica]GGE11629.1 MBL fold metallo-hydrolase [Aureimonas endophytica]